jgi:hypothetical protein
MNSFQRRNKISHNNQNTTLMKYYDEDNKRIMLLHDNRIFFFQDTTNDYASEDWEKLFNHYSNGIQHLLTIPKYRLIEAIYTIYKLADYLLFIYLVVTGINHFITNNFHFKYYIIFSVIIIELFYDIMGYTTRIWILNRLSVAIGIMLFVLYYLSFLYAKSDFTSYIALSIRLGIYILEVITDYCLDLEIHNDLCGNTRFLYFFEARQCLNADFQIAKKDYIGSILSWGCQSAFEAHPELNVHNNTIQYLSRIPLYIMIIILLIINIPLIILMFILYIFLKCCDGTVPFEFFYDELTYI